MAVVIAGLPPTPEKEKPVTDEIPLKSAPAKKVVGESAAILAQIRKDKGDKSIVTANAIPAVERIPTGCFEFDFATDGGFPMSRLSIVYGPESSGKSNICYLAAAQAQKRGVVVWVDLEGTFDPSWAVQFGVDIETLLVAKPGYGEEAVDMIDALVRASDVVLIVVDSIAVMTSAREVDASTEKMDVGTASVLVKRLSNKLAMAFSAESKRGHHPAVIFVNQTRYKIGVMFGDPETMPGGQTMKFLSSLTVRLYGKNKVDKTVSPDKPTYKDTVMVIKKAKVTVNKVQIEYDMNLIGREDMAVGETDSWNSVLAHLKSYGMLDKATPKGWSLFGEVFDTQVQIQDRYRSDPKYRSKLQKEVVAAVSGLSFLVEAQGLAAK